MWEEDAQIEKGYIKRIHKDWGLNNPKKARTTWKPQKRKQCLLFNNAQHEISLVCSEAIYIYTQNTKKNLINYQKYRKSKQTEEKGMKMGN